MNRARMPLVEFRQRQREFSARGSALPFAKLDETSVKAAREDYERARFAIAYKMDAQEYSILLLINVKEYTVSHRVALASP